MPYVFPGMDPYLEHPAIWPDVHHSLIVSIRDALSLKIAPHYTVRIEERVYLCSEDDPARKLFVPDLSVREPLAPAYGDSGSAAVADAVSVQVVIEDELREYFIEIRAAGGEEVVTVIEVLSPANKVLASNSRTTYMHKRHQWLMSSVNLVEIDLLRAGVRPPVLVGELPEADYYLMVSSVEERPMGRYWCVGLRRPIPAVPVPLKPNDPDAPLDLQPLLRDIYVRARYDLQLDYTGEPPEPPLSGDDADWLDGWLREQDLR